MAKRLQKKSTFGLIAMLVAALAIIAFMIWWPTPAAEQEHQTPPEQETIVKDGMAAPDFEVTMFDGQKVKLSDLKGKVVLINFWATWCPPCRDELARVEKDIIAPFKDKGFVFLPISRGETKEAVEKFRNKMGYTFPMGLDTDQSIYGKYATNYIPRNFLVGKDGKIVKISIGYDEAEFAELIKAIEKAIQK